MMTIFDAIIYKYPNLQGITYKYTKDDGSAWDDPFDGLVWEAVEVSKPTKEDLTNWMTEFDLQYRQNLARQARVYPSINDQLDMQYHDSVDGTTTWIDAVKAIKLEHPIPQE